MAVFDSTWVMQIRLLKEDFLMISQPKHYKLRQRLFVIKILSNSKRIIILFQDAVAAAGGQAALQQMASSVATSLGELSQAELSNIVGGLALESDGTDATDPDDILKQLGETAFDNFDTFFTDLTNNTASAVPAIEIKVYI